MIRMSKRLALGRLDSDFRSQIDIDGNALCELSSGKNSEEGFSHFLFKCPNAIAKIGRTTESGGIEITEPTVNCPRLFDRNPMEDGRRKPRCLQAFGKIIVSTIEVVDRPCPGSPFFTEPFFDHG